MQSCALDAIARHLGLFEKAAAEKHGTIPAERLFDGLTAREILRRKLAQLAGEELPEDAPRLSETE